jgi:hypothetical protein
MAAQGHVFGGMLFAQMYRHMLAIRYYRVLLLQLLGWLECGDVVALLLLFAGALGAIAGRLLCDTYLSARELVKEVDYTLKTLAR